MTVINILIRSECDRGGGGDGGSGDAMDVVMSRIIMRNVLLRGNYIVLVSRRGSAKPNAETSSRA